MFREKSIVDSSNHQSNCTFKDLTDLMRSSIQSKTEIYIAEHNICVWKAINNLPLESLISRYKNTFDFNLIQYIQVVKCKKFKRLSR